MTMHPETALLPVKTVRSANGLYRMMYQADGNLVLLGPAGPLWDSRSGGRAAGVCVMQADGNLVLYGPDEEYVWDSETHGNPGSRLVIQNGGNASNLPARRRSGMGDGDVTARRHRGRRPCDGTTGAPQRRLPRGFPDVRKFRKSSSLSSSRSRVSNALYFAESTGS